jgi:hypothetical protein
VTTDICSATERPSITPPLELPPEQPATNATNEPTRQINQRRETNVGTKCTSTNSLGMDPEKGRAEDGESSAGSRSGAEAPSLELAA